MISRELAEQLKDRITKLQSKRERMMVIIEQNRKQRDDAAEKLKEKGIDPGVSPDETLEKLENKAEQLVDQISSELSKWEDQLDKINEDLS